MRYFFTLILTTLILTASFVTATSVPLEEKKNENARTEEMFPLLDLFGACVAIIESDYVDEVDATNLVYGALRGMMRSLDPHSQFMEPKAVEQLSITTKGAFGGIGIEIGVRDNHLTVIAPIEDTPAFDAGILPKDTIIRINGENSLDMSLDQAIERLRGEPGTMVTVTVRRVREDMREIKTVPIERANIELKQVTDVMMLDTTNGVGYVRVKAFDTQITALLRDAIASLETQGMTSLILDLRNNGGGLLKTAIEMSSLFLPPDTKIVSTRGRLASQNHNYYAEHDGLHYDFPLAILVNGASASASEIVTGAIKDHRRGLIVGSKTFGKGSVQTVLPLGKDECALRLTTAKYYTPADVCIHGTGIFPTISVPLTLDEEIRLIQKRSRAHRTADVETMTEKEKKEYDKIKNTEDTQLERARDALIALHFLTGRETNISSATELNTESPQHTNNGDDNEK